MSISRYSSISSRQSSFNTARGFNAECSSRETHRSEEVNSDNELGLQRRNGC